MDGKDTNPKDALGIRKVPMSAVPVGVLMELGLAMMEGGLKYGRHNYRAVGVRASVYYDAIWRHLGAWWEGQNIDPDSGMSHITKAIACLTVLRDSMMGGNWVDDRPPASYLDMPALNELAGNLVDKYPSPAKTHTQKGSPEKKTEPKRLEDVPDGTFIKTEDYNEMVRKAVVAKKPWPPAGLGW